MRRAVVSSVGASRFLFLQISTLMLVASVMTLHVTVARGATSATAGVFVPHALSAHLQSHATTMLADGTVLITGGLDNSSTVKNTAADAK